MTEPAPFDPYALLRALERHQVAYVLIGGLARVLHGSDEVTRVRAVSRRVLQRTSPEDATDIVAETFTVAWRRWEDAPCESLPRLLGNARKMLANSRRSASRNTTLRAVRVTLWSGAPALML